MKKVLMICNYFAPDNKIAAVRPTKFAKYLTEAGYDVTVITELIQSKIEDTLLQTEVDSIPVYYAQEGWLCKKVDYVYQKITSSYRKKRYEKVTDARRYRINKETGEKEFLPFEIAYPVLGTMDYLIKIMKQKSLCRSMKKWLCQNKENYDVCFSTYGSHFGHYCSMYLKKINPEIKWIADFRDNVFNFKFNPPSTERLARKYENLVYKNCDIIVVVTQGLTKFVPEKYSSKVVCITNGYDITDRLDLNTTEDNKKFSFCYTGIMYGGLRKVTKLFEAIRELVDEKKVELDDVEFHYAGSGFSVFYGQAQSAGVEMCCINHGIVCHKDALKLQSESKFLIVASWDYKAQPVGTLTGKALEYMSAGKPIITLTEGDMPKNELSEVIREGNFGCAYDESHKKEDFEALKAYLIKQYQNFKAGKEPEYEPKKEVLERFDYRNLTKQLIGLIEK